MVLGRSHEVDSPDKQHRSSDDASKSTSTSHGGGFMDKLKNKVKDTHLYDVKVGAVHLKHRIGKFENLINRNHRHDEAHEQATDAKRTKIAEGHRFQSFAPERDGNKIKWYIDGRDYFHAVSVALERAKETIYIADWWLSPELFLRRPPALHLEYRLDTVLKRAAERGVKIYVIVYKEVEAAVSCNSIHTKHALEALCPEGSPGYRNIVVMRHPDHNVFENAGDMTFYWAHHEKFIVIDYDLAFIGGLDLCFGRWDTRQHPLADAHPSAVENEVFPGQDFNNNRIMDFKSVEDWKSNELSKADYGRMPWHDVAMGVIGPCVYDIAEHFVLRWNFVKRDKYKRDERYDWLTMTGRTGEDEDLVGVQRPKHPVGEYIHHPLSPLQHKTGNPRQGHLVHAGQESQAGPGAADEDGDEFHDAQQEQYDEHGYTQHQHKRGHGMEKRWQALEKEYDEHWEELHHTDKSQWVEKRFHEISSGQRPDIHSKDSRYDAPASAGVPGGGYDDAQFHPDIKAGEVSKQENPHVTGNQPLKEGTTAASGGVAEKSKAVSHDLPGNFAARGGQGSVHAQLVRSSADWSSGILTEQSIQNAYCEVIRGAKHFVYIENQFFITATGDKQQPIHNLIGAAIVDAVVAAEREGRKFRVIVVIPAIPGFAGDLRDDAALGTRAIMDYQYKSINRGEHSIYGRLKAANVDPTKYIFMFNLRSYDRINKTPGLKEQEEKSGVTYQDLQRAQAEEVMPTGVHGAKGDGSKKHPAAEDREYLKRGDHNNAKEAFGRTNHDLGLAGEGRDEKAQSEDTIAKDAMLGEPKVSEEGWAGRAPGDMKPKGDELQAGVDGGGTQGDEMAKQEKLRESETENFIQEELYIHGKLLIVDDRIVICGSSNINDRSQLGFHDSELSIVMEDTLPLESKMNGQPYTAGHHAATLRRMMWREHLGLLPAQTLDACDDPNAQPPSDSENDWYRGDEHDAFVEDPLSDEVWERWCSQATTNTQVFRHLFHADPDDNVKTFEQYDHFLGAKGSRKEGHLFDPYQPVDHVRESLDKVKGHLVWMPLDFLCEAQMAEKGLQVNEITESIYT